MKKSLFSTFQNPKSKIQNPHSKAFTLIELMIVVVILGLLATLIMPKLLNRPDQARHTKAIADLRTIQTALAAYKIDTGQYPTSTQGLQALVTNPSVKGYNPGGYLNNLPKDPWDNPYIYTHPSTHGKDYDLESYGKDGEDGGTTQNADIESWNLN